MSLVLDSSITLAWVYAAETTEQTAAVLERVLEAGAWVPALWRLEVANVLEMGVRKGRSSSSFRDAALADLALLPITVDLETDQHSTTRPTWNWRAAAAFRWRLWTRPCELPPRPRT